MNPVNIVLPFATGLAVLVGSETKITLGQAGAVFVFAGGLVWYLSSRLQRIEDNIKVLQKEVRVLGGKAVNEVDLAEE